MPVMVLGCDGFGAISIIVQGIEWAISDLAGHPGARGVISMSLGGSGGGR